MQMRRRAREEGGFTLLVVMGGLTVVILLSVVAVAAVRGDLHLVRDDLDHRQAYEAANAGLNDYVFHLKVDSAYWTHCTEVEAPSALNQQDSTANRRVVPGNTGGKYAIELLPATGKAKCEPGEKAAATMIEPSGPMKGTFRIRSTGYSGDTEVSIVATFKPASFLDYVYFTQRETLDPVTYGFANPSPALNGAYEQCGKTLQEGRNNVPIPNSPEEEYCVAISFVKGDAINGPMHTNDAFVMCETPTLGRSANDPVEVSAPPKGWYSTKEVLHSESTCKGSPTFKGTFITNAPVITPPPTNSELKKIAGLSFKGQVRICLSGASLTVAAGKSCSETVLYSGPIPSSGVVYVANDPEKSCSSAYSPYTAVYPATSPCGNAYVQGNYSGQLTIAAENDIIVNGSMVHSGEGVLGLIANNFVRVYHPFSSAETSAQTARSKCNSGSNGTGSISNLRIDAAILAINHSFIVDHYDCGAALGTLTVNGALAQKFRGPVGSTGTGGTGYIKSYNYDDRLHYLAPPSFIEPQESDWVIGRATIE
jgi:Tfp pilus assembly protein PilX